MDGLDAIQEIRNLIGKPGVSKEALSSLLDKTSHEHNNVLDKTNYDWGQQVIDVENQMKELVDKMIKPDNLLEEQLIDEFKSRLEQYRNGRLHINNIIANFNLIEE